MSRRYDYYDFTNTPGDVTITLGVQSISSTLGTDVPEITAFNTLASSRSLNLQISPINTPNTNTTFSAVSQTIGLTQTTIPSTSLVKTFGSFNISFNRRIPTFVGTNTVIFNASSLSIFTFQQKDNLAVEYPEQTIGFTEHAPDISLVHSVASQSIPLTQSNKSIQLNISPDALEPPMTLPAPGYKTTLRPSAQSIAFSITAIDSTFARTTLPSISMLFSRRIPDWQLAVSSSSQTIAFTQSNTTIFTPDQLTDLWAWFRADLGVTDSGGGTASAWADQSSNGYDLSAATGNEPAINTTDADFNGQASLEWDGSNQQNLAQTSTGLTQPFTVITVFWINAHTNALNIMAGSPNGNVYLGNRNNDTLTFNAGSSVNSAANYGTGELFLTTIVYNSSSSQYVDSSLSAWVGPADTNTNGTNGWFIGSPNASQDFDGKIAEQIIIDGAISNAQYNNLKKYMEDRYAVTWNTVS